MIFHDTWYVNNQEKKIDKLDIMKIKTTNGASRTVKPPTECETIIANHTW